MEKVKEITAAPAAEPLPEDNGEIGVSPIEESAVIEKTENDPHGHKNGIDIETDSIAQRNKLIVQLTWPALAENILATLVSMADTIMVSSLGAYAVSAVGLVTQPRFIMLSAFMGLGIGTTALVARSKGAGNRKQANDALRQSLILSAALVAVLCVVMYIFNEPLIRFIAGSQISEETVLAGADYFRIQIYGFPLLALTFIMNAALRGAGNTRAAFYSNSAANIVNIFFNYCFINGHLGFPALGVAGASIATVIGQTVAFLFCLYLLLNNKQYVQLVYKQKFRVDFSMINRIFKIGMPALLEQLIMRVGMLLYTKIVTSLGDNSYTAHIVAMNIQTLSFTTGMSFGTAATTLTGQSLGRKRPDLARSYVSLAQRMGIVVSVVVALILFFFGGTLASLYSNDPAIIALVAQVLMIIALANPLSNARFVYNSALRGAGDSTFTAIATFVGILVVRPLVAVLLVYVIQLDLVGVWIALVSDALVCFAMAAYRWRKGKWAQIKV